MGSKIGTPTTRAFDVIVVELVEPHSEAVLARPLSDMVVDIIVDSDFPVRDCPDVLWKRWGISRHLPAPRETTTPSSSLR
jgi:hypothetical protein